MGKRRCSILAVAGLIAVISILSGCGGNGSVTVTSVAITPTTATVNPGAQTDFTAVVNLSNTTTTSTTSTAVTWEVNGIVGGNSSVGTILSSTTDNQVGIYTAPSIVPSTNNGQVNITAVAQQTQHHKHHHEQRDNHQHHYDHHKHGHIEYGGRADWGYPGVFDKPLRDERASGRYDSVLFHPQRRYRPEYHLDRHVIFRGQSRLHWPKNGSLYGAVVPASG